MSFSLQNYGNNSIVSRIEFRYNQLMSRRGKYYNRKSSIYSGCMYSLKIAVRSLKEPYLKIRQGKCLQLSLNIKIIVYSVRGILLNISYQSTKKSKYDKHFSDLFEIIFQVYVIHSQKKIIWTRYHNPTFCLKTLKLVCSCCLLARQR